MELKARWPTLLGVTIGMALGATGLLPYVSGVFAKAITKDMGWTLTQLSTVSLFMSLGTSMIAPLWGGVVDKIGAWRTAAISFTAMVLAMLALSSIPRSFAAYAACIAAVTWLGTGTSGVTFVPILRETFDRQRGLALGLLLAGVAVVGIFAPVLAATVIHNGGWRVGYRFLALAGAAGGAASLAILALSRAGMKPGEAGSSGSQAAAPGALRALMKDPVLWRFVVAFLALSVAVNGYLFHMVPMLTSYGLSLQQAAATQSAFGLGMIAVRLLAGALMDRFFAPRLTIYMIALACVGLAILATRFGGAAGYFPAVLLLGVIYGSEVDLIGYLTSRYFGAATFGRAYGLIYGCGILGSGVGPLWISLLSRNGTHYAVPLLTSIALLAIPAVAFFTAPPYREKPQP